MDGARGGQGPVHVAVRQTAGRLPDGRVEQDVGGSGVVRQRSARPGRHRDVGDAAQVEGDGNTRPVAQPHHVQGADQRRPLASGRDVARAQVGDDGASGAFGDPGGLSDLEGAADPAALRPVVDGLPV